MSVGKYNPRNITKRIVHEATLGTLNVTGVTTIATRARRIRSVQASIDANSSPYVWGIQVPSVSNGVVTIQLNRAGTVGSGVGGVGLESGWLASGQTVTLVINAD